MRRVVKLREKLRLAARNYQLEHRNFPRNSMLFFYFLGVHDANLRAAAHKRRKIFQENFGISFGKNNFGKIYLSIIFQEFFRSENFPKIFQNSWLKKLVENFTKFYL